MIESLKNTALYKSLNLSKNIHHAYLFYSLDKELNNNIALIFAKTLICENKSSCKVCNSCKQFDNGSHPDFIKIEQETIKVDDVNALISKLNTKPISSDYKVFLILNAENINEISQNKLLKSLEEPNVNNIFILTTSKIDKLLPTVLSRLHKVNIPKLTTEDFILLKDDLKNINYSNNMNLNLTEIINFETNENYIKTIKAINYIFDNLNSSQDIPKVSSSIPEFDKTLLFPILQKIFLACINNANIIDEHINSILKTYPTQALINSLPLIEDAYKKQQANVNLGYILDNLLFNILKEKFLCKQ